MTGRLPRLALFVLVVGLALHNLAMALLWQAGVRDTALDVVAAWKDVLLLVALVLALAVGSIPQLGWADRLALAYGALVVIYAIAPQSWLGGDATGRGELYALRHHLLPLGAYILGRLLVLDRAWWRRICVTLVAVGVGLAAWGLVDVYLVPLQWWRDSGVPDWFSEQLGLAYRCLSGLPENWILNTDEESPVRRLVSTFLSPLATAYALVAVLLLLAAARPRRWTVAASVLVYVGLLWTHTRAAFIALPAGFLVLALLRRSWTPAALGVGSVVVTAAFVALFPTIGPTTTYTTTELACLRENAAVEGSASDDPFSTGESSTSSHLSALREGVRTVARHPWGYGLGNSGVSASRTGVTPKAGESTYTELGVDTGLLGLAAFVGWLVAVFLALRTPVAVARRVDRRRRGARAPDGRDRHPLALGRRLRARRRGAPPRAGRPGARGRALTVPVTRRPSRSSRAARRRRRRPCARRGRRSRPSLHDEHHEVVVPAVRDPPWCRRGDVNHAAGAEQALLASDLDARRPGVDEVQLVLLVVVVVEAGVAARHHDHVHAERLDTERLPHLAEAVALAQLLDRPEPVAHLAPFVPSIASIVRRSPSSKPTCGS